MHRMVYPASKFSIRYIPGDLIPGTIDMMEESKWPDRSKVVVDAIPIHRFTGSSKPKLSANIVVASYVPSAADVPAVPIPAATDVVASRYAANRRAAKRPVVPVVLSVVAGVAGQSSSSKSVNQNLPLVL